MYGRQKARVISGRSKRRPSLQPSPGVPGEGKKSASFNEKVWDVTRRIPSGRVATYSDVAAWLGTRGYRAVGNALHRNPYAPVVPCHRVVGSDGKLTGYAGGLAAKRRLLEREGVRVADDRVDLAAYRWRP